MEYSCRPVDRKIPMTNFIFRMPVKISDCMRGFKKCLLIQNILKAYHVIEIVNCVNCVNV